MFYLGKRKHVKSKRGYQNLNFFPVSSMVWLFWLLTLNSVVNPWIYMMFNANLVESLCHIFCRADWGAASKGSNRRHRNAGPGRLFGQSGRSEMTNGGGISETGNSRLTGTTGGKLTAGAMKSYDRSRSNSGGSQTSFTIMTTTEMPGTGTGRKSRSPSPQNRVTRFDTLPVIRERNS
jgi:hypothetical protein